MPRELIVSPRGEALWAKVFEPTSFEEGSPRAWSIRLLLDPSDPTTIAFTERLEAIFEDFHGPKAKVARYGWPFAEQETKDEKGRALKTGLIEFRFKRNERWPSGEPQTPPIVVDSKKNLWPNDKLIGNGSKVKVAFVCAPWDIAGKGMSLILEQLQVIDLVEYESSVDPFSEEDGGYVLDTPGAQSPFDREGAVSTGFAAQLRARAAEVQAEAAQVVTSDLPF